MSKARKPTALADVDIAEEGRAQTDGLMTKLQRSRGPTPETPAAALRSASEQKSRNAWRDGKALIQVAIPKNVHKELRLMAVQRDLTLTDVVTSALNDWLAAHGSVLMIP